MLLGAPRKERTLPIASVWTSSLRNSKRIHFCSFKAPRWWHYLQQRLQTNSSRLWSQRVVGVGRAPALEWGRGRGSPVGAVKYLGMGGRARAGGHRRQALSKGPTGRRCFVLFPFSTKNPYKAKLTRQYHLKQKKKKLNLHRKKRQTVKECQKDVQFKSKLKISTNQHWYCIINSILFGLISV